MKITFMFCFYVGFNIADHRIKIVTTKVMVKAKLNIQRLAKP